MSSSAKGFGALADYLAKGRSGEESDRVAWSTSRNLPTHDPELAGKIMRATAAQNVRVRDPVYHLALSFDPGDQIDRAAMEHVADRVIAALDLHGHQVLIVSHRDRGHPHMHLMINRVHPETGRVWNRWQDRAVIQRVLREEEQALGLRVVPGRLTSREQLPLELTTSKPPRRDTGEQRRDTSVPERSAVDAKPRKLGKVEELTNHIRLYERSAELTREQYTVEMETASARARTTQLDDALQRIDKARTAFDHALAKVYRDPSAAHERFRDAVNAVGAGDALRTMRERPAEFGALITADKRRAFRLAQSPDDSAARAAAGETAAKGRAAIDAEAALTRIRLPERSVSPEITSQLPGIATPGLDGANAQAPGRPEALINHAAVELLASRAALERASARQAATRQELLSTPDRADLERRIVDLLERMSPRELRQLRSALAPPHVGILLRLKSTVRDTLLGREEGQQR